MSLKVLIVDDEPPAREGLKMMLASDSLAIEARNGREAVARIRDEKPDLVLLDVQMPRMDGFAVIEAVGADKMPAVIFVTAHDQYAVRAFEISAVDYLLKPVTEERFRIAFERARNRLRAAPPNEFTSGESARQMRAVLDAIANPRRYLSRLAIRSGDRTIFLPIGEVEWMEAAQNYVCVHASQTTHLLHVPMNTIEELLDPERFVRIHRSYIVNLGHIRQLWTLPHRQYVLELASGERLPSGRTYAEKIRTLLANPF
jgi:two-component system, LytTR family, response regulator